MGVSPAVFQSAGRRTEHYLPGGYSRSEAEGGGGSGLSAGNSVLLGKSAMGEPGALYAFSTAREAFEVLGEGELSKAVAHAFNPSPDYAPQKIYAMVVNGNTQAGRVLKAGGMEILRLKSAVFGVPANRLASRFSNGEAPGTKKIAFEFGETAQTIDNIGRKSLQIQYTGDGEAAVLDVNNSGLSVEITRNDPVPALDIIGLNGLRVGEAKPFTVHAANPEGADLMVAARIDVDGIDPALFELEYFDIEAGSVWVPVDTAMPFRGPAGFVLQTGDLRFRLTPLAGAEGRIMEYGITLLQVISGAITANVIAQTTRGKIEIAAAGAPYSGYNIPAYDSNSGSLFLAFENFPTIEALVSRLNAAGEFAAVQLETAANAPSFELDAVSALDIKTSERTLKSDLYALIHAIESAFDVGAGNVEKIAGALNLMSDNDSDWVYFEGASAGTYTVEDWNNALSALEAENVQIISTPATDQAVHTLISNHCTAMSSVQNRKERTAFVGGPVGEALARAAERAATLNNKLVSYCYPWITAASPLTGAAEILPASFLACKLMGMECAVAVNEPLTWKSLGVLRFGAKLKLPRWKNAL